ncbi:tRNA (adenosine(37)-N6)-dimethylallyltransferase MiaA [Candidatus Parcubacteria bacterium]|nr:tRNA (adenosine(37)-N6)-dimethylallyltransferase MiaA [Candidatus Parcubacteria bacterium]
MNKILVIVGPTASGKSDLAVRLAKRFKGEVVSADSRQVYKGLDVGTGKITRSEMRGVTHYLLSIINPKEQFTVAEFKKLALLSLQYIVLRNKLPIIVGGTGFYIDAVTKDASLPEVAPDKKLREKLDKKSAEELFEILKVKDPERAKSIDKHNKVRLVRALEIIEVLGKVPPLHELDQGKKFIFIGLRPDKKELEERIYKRLINRTPGMVREASRLHKQGLTWRRMEELGLEYRYLARLLQKKITKEEFLSQLFSEIKRYAKRQNTWFKRNKRIRWFKPNEYKSIEKYLTKRI